MEERRAIQLDYTFVLETTIQHEHHFRLCSQLTGRKCVYVFLSVGGWAEVPIMGRHYLQLPH